MLVETIGNRDVCPGTNMGWAAHGDMAADTCHEGWGRGMVTPTRVTRGHVSRASNMQAWETMGMLHAVAICIVYFLHLLTQRVHFQVELSFTIISTSRRCDPLVLYLYMVIADL